MGPLIEKNHHLVVLASGENRPGLLDALLTVASSCQCYVSDTRMVLLGNSFVMSCQLTGIWSSIAKVEVMLPQAAKPLGLHLEIRRTFYEQNDKPFIPYSVQIIGVDEIGIASEVVNFFSKQGFEITEFLAEPFQIPHAKTRMLTFTLTLHVPPKTPIANVREGFLTFCDDKNLDGLLEPFKPPLRAV